MRKQRIYRGGTQFHEHYEMPHAGPMLHDGYWRHYHDKEGMMAVEEEGEGDRTPQGAAIVVTLSINADDFDRLCENSGDLRQAFPALYGRLCDETGTVLMQQQWRQIYWMGDQYVNVLLARSFLDAIGEPCQIAVDEGADDHGRANGWVILTDYASPVWDKNGSEEKLCTGLALTPTPPATTRGPPTMTGTASPAAPMTCAGIPGTAHGPQTGRRRPSAGTYAQRNVTPLYYT